MNAYLSMFHFICILETCLVYELMKSVEKKTNRKNVNNLHVNCSKCFSNQMFEYCYQIGAKDLNIAYILIECQKYIYPHLNVLKLKWINKKIAFTHLERQLMIPTFLECRFNL